GEGPARRGCPPGQGPAVRLGPLRRSGRRPDPLSRLRGASASRQPAGRRVGLPHPARIRRGALPDTRSARTRRPRGLDSHHSRPGSLDARGDLLGDRACRRAGAGSALPLAGRRGLAPLLPGRLHRPRPARPPTPRPVPAGRVARRDRGRPRDGRTRRRLPPPADRRRLGGELRGARHEPGLPAGRPRALRRRHGAVRPDRLASRANLVRPRPRFRGVGHRRCSLRVPGRNADLLRGVAGGCAVAVGDVLLRARRLAAREDPRGGPPAPMAGARRPRHRRPHRPRSARLRTLRSARAVRGPPGRLHGARRRPQDPPRLPRDPRACGLPPPRAHRPADGTRQSTLPLRRARARDRPGARRRPARSAAGDRPRPLQRAERHARPSGRRPAARADRTAASRGAAEGLTARPTRRRRVCRGPPARLRRRRGARGGPSRTGGGDAPVRAERSARGRRRERRRRGVPRSRRQRRVAAAASRHRDVQRQGRPHGRGDLRARARRPQPRPPRPRRRPPRRRGTRRARRALSAEGRPEHGRDRWGRGPGPLATPDARPASARRVPAARRGDGAHGPADPARPRALATAGSRLAPRRYRPQRRRQRGRAQPARSALPRAGDRGAAALRPAAGAAPAGDHGGQHHERPRARPRRPRSARRARRQVVPRRLRNGTVVALAAQAPAGRRDQDRPVVRPRHVSRPHRSGDRPLGGRARAQPRAARGRRGCRERRDLARARPPGMRSAPGLLPEPPGPRERAHRLAARTPRRGLEPAVARAGRAARDAGAEPSVL
ncbi:MAG: diguanylate cyclase/phosphodiesterase (GGDEF & EAL domains) with PAS/PAC sensor(s), partial [uncultured Solirubrobacterales bacterium]